ncbi:GSCFA domain-containing protein [Shimia isoporae]|nr:GSCFA domain-containing protein [Shimia isoporae]
MTAFTIGSCFAREIEEKLTFLDVPTLGLTFPERIVKGRENSVLNEFNPGSISQRIRWAIDGVDTREFDQSFSASGNVATDLLLAKGHKLPVEDLLGIRERIDEVYNKLPASDFLIITLGMTQCWVDHETGHYLNRMPSPRDIKKEPNRYTCRFLTLSETVDLLKDALERALSSGVKGVLLTVSPVPLQQTFLPIDCAIANSHSKSTLRLAVTELLNMFPEQVNYFPSYEIVLSGGLHSFEQDHIHVKREVVSEVTDYMASHYLES